jgi:hypothetical protein
MRSSAAKGEAMNCQIAWAIFLSDNPEKEKANQAWEHMVSCEQPRCQRPVMEPDFFDIMVLLHMYQVGFVRRKGETIRRAYERMGQ